MGYSLQGHVFLMKAFALELGKGKIHVNSTSSSIVRTDLLKQFGQGVALNKAAAPNPVGRVCEVKEITDVVVFPLGDKSQMLAGSDVVIDGGHMCYLPA